MIEDLFGEQTGEQVKALANLTPSCANLSIFGVKTSLLP
jgi:hypothetical protein